MAGLSSPLQFTELASALVRTPHSQLLITKAFGLSCVAFTRRYYPHLKYTPHWRCGMHCWFLFSAVNKMFSAWRAEKLRVVYLLFKFQFSAFAFAFKSIDVCLANVHLSWTRIQEDVLFGNLWFKCCLRIATAFRSLPRPSSPREPSYPPDSVGASCLRSGPVTASLLMINIIKQKLKRIQKLKILRWKNFEHHQKVFNGIFALIPCRDSFIYLCTALISFC